MPHLTLCFLVPLLKCNLLSVSKLTRNTDWDVRFSPDLCVFQDRCLGKTIGTAKHVDGLYFLAVIMSLLHLIVAIFPFLLTVQSCSYIVAWVIRYLKKLYPSIFINKSPSLFTCEICQLAKHHRVSVEKKSTDLQN